jgi:alginate O-acetyltransferase complex protein AlgI
MLFCSARFACFFLIVFAVYWLLPWRRLRLALPFRYILTGDEVRVWWLLAASFYFYAAWDLRLALLITATTLMDYLIGLGLHASARQPLRKALLLLSLAVNLGLLVLFKYANFFLHSVEQALHAAGSTSSLPVLKVLLPVGISFYTFEAISYTVDVYRRRIPAERNLAHFMLFILFFPHLIAGPIVRARDFLPQVRRRKRLNWDRMHLGVAYFLLGLLKKWAVADRMALFVEPVFADPAGHSSYAVWVAVLAYALQVYADFSGYTDMALGTAHLLGYRLAINFNMPYLALNVADYWRRWHISLSTWLRDYLYIPMGGSRGSGWRTAGNLLFAMTLCGLWHGASWMYVAWGTLQGVYLVAHRGFRGFCRARPTLDGLLQTSPCVVLRWAFTLGCICAGYVVFRAASFADAGILLHRLLIPHAGAGPIVNSAAFWATALGVALFHVAGQGEWWRRLFARAPAPVLGASYALALTVCLVIAPYGDRMFIYFQF